MKGWELAGPMRNGPSFLPIIIPSRLFAPNKLPRGLNKNSPWPPVYPVFIQLPRSLSPSSSVIFIFSAFFQLGGGSGTVL